MRNDPGSLSKIIQQQGCLYKDPGNPDITHPAMTKVRIQSLGPGSTKKNGPKEQESVGVRRQQFYGVVGIDGQKDFRTRTSWTRPRTPIIETRRA